MQKTWQDLADMLRRLMPTEFYQRDPGLVEFHVRLCQSMSDELDIETATRNILKPGGRGSRKPEFLLQCMLLATSRIRPRQNTKHFL